MRVDPAEATRLVDHSERFCDRVSLTGQPLPAPLPAVAAACANGTVGEGHLRVITAAMDAVTDIPDLEPSVVTDAEAALVEHAATLAPAGLARAARRLVETLDPDGIAPVDPPEPVDEMSLSRSKRDGSVGFAGRVHGPDAELLVEVLDASSGLAGADDTRTLGRRPSADTDRARRPGRLTHRHHHRHRRP